MEENSFKNQYSADTRKIFEYLKKKIISKLLWIYIWNGMKIMENCVTFKLRF